MLTVKSQRLLQQLGIVELLKRGGRVLAGPTYELRKDPGIFARLVFDKEENILQVGYAICDGAAWEIVESEPFSFRALGYYERRLKRLGDFAKNEKPAIVSAPDAP